MGGAGFGSLARPAHLGDLLEQPIIRETQARYSHKADVIAPIV